MEDKELDELLFPVYNYGWPGTGMPGTQQQMTMEQLKEEIKKLVHQAEWNARMYELSHIDPTDMWIWDLKEKNCYPVAERIARLKLSGEPSMTENVEHGPAEEPYFGPIQKEEKAEEKMMLSYKWDDTLAQFQYSFHVDGEKKAWGDAMWARRMADHYGIEYPEA